MESDKPLSRTAELLQQLMRRQAKKIITMINLNILYKKAKAIGDIYLCSQAT